MRTLRDMFEVILLTDPFNHVFGCRFKHQYRVVNSINRFLAIAKLTNDLEFMKSLYGLKEMIVTKVFWDVAKSNVDEIENEVSKKLAGRIVACSDEVEKMYNEMKELMISRRVRITANEPFAYEFVHPTQSRKHSREGDDGSDPANKKRG